MRKYITAIILVMTSIGVGAFFLIPSPDRIPDSSHLPDTGNETAVKNKIPDLIPEKATVADYQNAITKHGARKVLWEVFYNNDRFEHLLNQISTGNKSWYLIAKELRKESDAGASEQLDEAILQAEEKVPGLDPTSPKYVFKGQPYDSFTGDNEVQALKAALKMKNIPFTSQVKDWGEIVSWPRKFTPQVRIIDELYYCDPDLPEYRTYDSNAKFKECMTKNGIAFSTAVCHKEEKLVLSEESVERKIKENLCNN